MAAAFQSPARRAVRDLRAWRGRRRRRRTLGAVRFADQSLLTSTCAHSLVHVTTKPRAMHTDRKNAPSQLQSANNELTTTRRHVSIELRIHPCATPFAVQRRTLRKEGGCGEHGLRLELHLSARSHLRADATMARRLDRAAALGKGAVVAAAQLASEGDTTAALRRAAAAGDGRCCRRSVRCWSVCWAARAVLGLGALRTGAPCQ